MSDRQNNEGALGALLKADPFANEKLIGDKTWVEEPVPEVPTPGLMANVAWVLVSISAGVGVWGLMDAIILFARSFH